MADEISPVGRDRLSRLSGSRKAKVPTSEGSAAAPRNDGASEPVVSSELRELIDRVKQAENYRKERVHQVWEKLQRGELLAAEALQEAAEKMLDEGA